MARYWGAATPAGQYNLICFAALRAYMYATEVGSVVINWGGSRMVSMVSSSLFTGGVGRLRTLGGRVSRSELRTRGVLKR